MTTEVAMLNSEYEYGCAGNGGMIVMQSGTLIDFNEPKASDFNIIDIASALSMICRWGGHTKFHYSVAQHSVLCADQAMEDGHSTAVCFACLMHDTGESVITDVPRPIKRAVPQISVMEAKVERAIEEAFGVDLITHHDIVKKIDNEVLACEARQLFTGSERWMDHSLVRRIDQKIEELTPDQACQEFLWMYEVLRG